MKKKKKRKRNFRAKNDKHARYTLRKFTSAPLRNSISIPIANIGIGAFEARSMIPKEKERATFDDKIEGNVDTPFFFFFPLSSLFSPLFSSFFFSSFRSRPAQWLARNKAWEHGGSKTSRRIRYVDMWESTSRRRTIGATLIAILHRSFVMLLPACARIQIIWQLYDIWMTLSYFTGTTRRFVSCFVNVLLPTTEIFEMVLLSEFSILFLFILERVG